MITLLVMILTASLHQDRFANELVVVLDGIERSDGIIRIGVFNHADDFMSKAFAFQDVPGTTHRITFEGLPEGEYAISIYHDLNSNGRLDTNLLGLPKEPYGFSQNPGTLLGPPSFKAASFHHDGKHTELKIKL